MLDCIVQGKGIVNFSSIDPQLSLMFSEVLIVLCSMYIICIIVVYRLLHMYNEFMIDHLCIYGIDILMVDPNCIYYTIICTVHNYNYILLKSILCRYIHILY